MSATAKSRAVSAARFRGLARGLLGGFTGQPAGRGPGPGAGRPGGDPGALGQVPASLRKATSVRKGPARRLAAGGSPRDAGVNHGGAGVARRLPRPRVKPIIAEFERSFGWRGVRARISRAPVAPVQVTLWVPGVPSPAMALLARSIEAEWAAAGQSLHIRLMAAADG